MKAQIILLFCLFTYLISLSLAADCPAQLSCDTCTNKSITAGSCGWCSANKRCYPGNSIRPNVTDPTVPFCDIGWIWAADDCADECSILAQDCFDCQAIQHIDCVWTKQNKCRLNGTVDPGYITNTCNCNMYKHVASAMHIKLVIAVFVLKMAYVWIPQHLQIVLSELMELAHAI